jgi:hypothetical protein
MATSPTLRMSSPKVARVEAVETLSPKPSRSSPTVSPLDSQVRLLLVFFFPTSRFFFPLLQRWFQQCIYAELLSSNCRVCVSSTCLQLGVYFFPSGLGCTPFLCILVVGFTCTSLRRFFLLTAFFFFAILFWGFFFFSLQVL